MEADEKYSQEQKCLVCSKNVVRNKDANEVKKSFIVETNDECRTVTDQLEAIFLLRRLLMTPEDVCCELLKDYGNPCSWIRCCDACTDLVAEAKNIFDQMQLLEKRYKKLQKKLKFSIISTANTNERHNSASEGGAKEIIRFYVREAWKSTNFFDGSESATKVKTEHLSDSEYDDVPSCVAEPCMENYSDEFYEDQGPLQYVKNKTSTSFTEQRTGRDGPFMENNIKQEVKSSSSVLLNEQCVNMRYSCSICERTYSTVYKLKYHKQKHKEGKEFLRKSSKLQNFKRAKFSLKNQKREKPHACGTCGKKFCLLANLKCHEKIHTGGNSKECEFCGKTFSHSGGLSFHLQSHTGEKPYKCDICHKSFAQNNDLKTHLNMHTGEKPFECEVCGKKFASSSNKAKHKKTHLKNEKQCFPCEICQKTFTKSSTLNSHMKTHSEENYFCECCGKLFKQSSSLKSHMKIHVGNKPFTCEVCGKSFIQSTNLKTHMKIHTGEKPFECDICGKRFIQLNNLNVHIKTHSDDKPYGCNICTKRFRKLSYFKDHMKGHEGKSSFTCTTCGKSFTHSYHLQRHERNHTGEKPFPCNTCDKAFIQSSDLRRHEKTHITGNKNIF